MTTTFDQCWCRLVGPVAAVTVVAGVLAGCQSPDQGDTADGMSVDTSVAAGQATTSSHPPASDYPTGVGPEAAVTSVPQVGDGTGLAEVDYVPVDREVFPQVDDSDPQQVLTRGLEVSFGWDPARDAGQFEGFRRAHSLWNNRYLRDGELALTTLVPMSRRSWQSWGDAGTRIVPRVHVLSDQHPPDTASDFYRVVAIDQTELTAGGASDDSVVTTLVATVRVHKTPLGWRLETINVIDNIVGGSGAAKQ
ncbi:hypothetical protein [Corynebacterium bovis]|uniref:hypothetical protein n=1 Tax=Corynebacterium bovis TaxID=36808 RepID=UPI000F654EBA|nr:hypothetical protein [Corynebacterium bovis]